MFVERCCYEKSIQMHSGREHSLEQQYLELQVLVEQREGEWQQREKRLKQTIADKDELLQRFGLVAKHSFYVW